MDTTHLRIGNYVRRRKSKLSYETAPVHLVEIEPVIEGLQIASIRHRNVNLRISKDTIVRKVDANSIYPIPITEKILTTQLGFKTTTGVHFTLENFTIVKLVDGSFVRNSFVFIDGADDVISEPIPFIHDLQNMFFCAKRKELTLIKHNQ